jgi:hypothetical protein
MIITLLAAGMLAAVLVAPAGAKGKPADAPNTACMQAGIAALKSPEVQDLLQLEPNTFAFVAKNGLPVLVAVGLGVEINNPEIADQVPDPIPLAIVLADHRAGDAGRAFNYPWCGQTG